MIIGELAIFPTSEGASVSKYVKEVIKIIENSGLKSYTGGMATTIEAPNLRALFDVVEETDKILANMGARRIHIDLHVDHRLDKEATVESKLKAVEKS